MGLVREYLLLKKYNENKKAKTYGDKRLQPKQLDSTEHTKILAYDKHISFWNKFFMILINMVASI